MSDGAAVAAPRAVVAAHGDLAAGLTSAVAAITGRTGDFVPLTNRDLDREATERLLREVIERTGVRVVFTDLPAGSWTLAARRVQRTVPGLVVVTGVSLPTLLDFALGGTEPLRAARQAADRGRAALAVAEPPVSAPGA